MPTSGPVYQPTTVSYEQQNEWPRPGSYLSQTVSSNFRSPRCLQWILLAFALFSFGAGLIILIEGTVDFNDNLQIPMKDGEGNDIPGNSSSRLGLTIIGSIMIVVGVILFIAYIRIAIRRKECPCYPSKEERLAMHLDAQGGNGQIHTMNPSTDLLVAAQYGPVSEIAYQPPAHLEHEERSKLMATDHKDSNEENERMLENDPRIVLRPLSHNEDV
uniref:DNA-directed RNA polymerase III subunit RPC3 n=2 Tax=Lygus hesperus TaxID=30085 RepID=A0A0A9Y067_LYGHE